MLLLKILFILFCIVTKGTIGFLLCVQRKLLYLKLMEAYVLDYDKKFNIYPNISFLECCRIKEFSTSITGKVLVDHVIKTLHVAQEETCKIHCYLSDFCQSINISPRHESGMSRCELSDTDEHQNPESFIEADGYKYYATKVTDGAFSPFICCSSSFLNTFSFFCFALSFFHIHVLRP